MSGRAGRNRLLRLGAAVLPALLLLSAAGCHGSRKAVVVPPEAAAPRPYDNAAGAAADAIPPVIPIVEGPPPPEKAGPPEGGPAPAVRDLAGGEPEKPAGATAPREEKTEAPAPPEGPGTGPTESAAHVTRPETASPRKQPRVSAPTAETPRAKPGPEAFIQPVPPPPAREGVEPPWARGKESLAFRVDFLGITMGYARFLYKGKVSVGGKAAYHVNVRAWTSGILSYIYPINETIDYYLDMETIAPVRIEYTGRKKKRDDVAVYDQVNGRIEYRYLDDGQVRKTVDVVPTTHDPVTAVYYFRWKDMGREDRPRNVYGGRKVYQIAAVFAGSERLRTNSGEVDTLVVAPVIRRDGKPENKGDLKMWVTNDERRVPVRIYGKFRKIKEWTLVGELMPERAGG